MPGRVLGPWWVPGGVTGLQPVVGQVLGLWRFPAQVVGRWQALGQIVGPSAAPGCLTGLQPVVGQGGFWELVECLCGMQYLFRHLDRLGVLVSAWTGCGTTASGGVIPLSIVAGKASVRCSALPGTHSGWSSPSTQV